MIDIIEEVRKLLFNLALLLFLVSIPAVVMFYILRFQIESWWWSGLALVAGLMIAFYMLWLVVKYAKEN